MSSPAYAADPATASGTPRTTYQTNGTVFSIKIVNNVAYVGGNFTKVRPAAAAPGTHEVSRNRIAAFDASTGALLPWNPNLTAPIGTLSAGAVADVNCTKVDAKHVECASVFAIKTTPDNRRLIIGGDFDFVGGKFRGGLASFELPSGALDANFRPNVNGRIHALAVSPSQVYVGGAFDKINGAARGQLGAVRLSDGATTAFANTITRSAFKAELRGIRAMEITPDFQRVIIGGGFDAVGATAIHGIAALDPANGHLLPWTDADKVNIKAAVTSLVIDNGTLYTTSEATVSESEGVIAFNANTGAVVWYDGCHGDSHSAAVINGVVYVGTHAHDCGAMVDGYQEQYHNANPDEARRYTLRAETPTGETLPDGTKRVKLLHWFPWTNDGNGANAMASDGKNLWIGGEFTKVDYEDQQGLTHFSLPTAGGINNEPERAYAPIPTIGGGGKVNVYWHSTEDVDSPTLQYDLFRDGVKVASVLNVLSRPWMPAWMSWTDNAAQVGETHAYSVKAYDEHGAAGNMSNTVNFQVDPASPTGSGATSHYDFNSPSGANFTDSVSGRIAQMGTGVTAGVDDKNPTAKVIKLDGAAGGTVVEQVSAFNTRQISYTITFRTETNGYAEGGVLLSLGQSNDPQSGSSASTAMLYLSDDGKLNFGTLTRGLRDPWAAPNSLKRVATTGTTYNDGEWHTVTAQLSPHEGVKIFDGSTLVASDDTILWTRTYQTSLRIGGDTVSGWPSQPSSGWLKGSIDDVSVYPFPIVAIAAGAPVNPPVEPPVATVKANQRVKGAVARKIRTGKVASLPTKTNAGRTIRWRSLTPKTCSISSGHRLKGRRAGICRVRATVKTTATLKALNATYKIYVVRRR